MNKKAIIIGAGPAGITAGYILAKNGITPVILEQSDNIGGISRTEDISGNRMDIGGHRFFSKNKEINDLWLEIMPLQAFPSKDDIITNTEKPLPDSGPDPEKADRTFLLRRRVSRIYYNGRFFDYPISLSFDTVKKMGFSNTLKAGAGYLYSSVFKRKELSLEDFYINRFGAPLYSMFFESYTEKLWGIHPSEISPEWGAQRVKGLSLMKAVLSKFAKNKDKETSLIGRFYYPKKGPGQFWEALAEETEKLGGKIIKNASVSSVSLKDGKIASVMTSDGDEYTADHYISSMAVKDLIASFDTAPDDIKEIAAALPYRDFITAGILLKKLKAENETSIKTPGNILPDTWIYIQEKDIKMGRIQIFNNWSPYMVSDFENTVFIGTEYFCTEGDDFWNMNDEDIASFAISELCKMGICDKSDIISKNVIRQKKAYPAYFGAYKDFGKVKDYLISIDNLFCIGRQGMHRYNNMDHSMLTAMETCRVILNGKDKESPWLVNTESEYNEETSK